MTRVYRNDYVLLTCIPTMNEQILHSQYPPPVMSYM